MTKLGRVRVVFGGVNPILFVVLITSLLVWGGLTLFVGGCNGTPPDSGVDGGNGNGGNGGGGGGGGGNGSVLLRFAVIGDYGDDDDNTRDVSELVKSWDPDLIVTIFTETATYHERVFEEPIRGHEGIRGYWQGKVVASQARIECELLALYVDGETAIAEWEACFDDLAQGVRKRMREVAILEFEDGLIAGLREYWASETVDELA